ncbi:MAG: hypothetical protein HZB41_06370 [Ignavibacteriae bacterium]|nr:hypothetical protein [Ignavibacteriota bacterium]
MKFKILFIFTFILITICASAQSGPNVNESMRYGLFGGYNLNQNKALFQKLPGITNCCPNFENGSGTGINLGLLFDYELPYSFRTGLKAGISSLNNKLSTLESTLVRIGNDTSEGVFEHSIDAEILNLTFEPYLSYNPVLGIKFSAGMSFGYLITKNFHQLEKIMQPSDRGVFFETQKRTRIDTSGELPNSNGIISS